MDGLRIEAIGPRDPRFAEWHAAIAGAYAHAREPGWWESLASARIYFEREGDRTAHVALVAELDGGVVGGAEVTLPLDDDTETLSADVGVLPPARRQGVGTALVTAIRELASREERRIWQAEVLVPTGLAPERWPGIAFAEGLGLRCATVEHRFLLDLPLSDAQLDGLWSAPAAPAADAVAHPDEVVSWVGACPEEHVGEWARMRTQMNQDVPTGELTVTPRAVDAQQIRDSDSRMAAQGWTKVRSMAVGRNGGGHGYTELFVSAHDPDVVVQDDTWVAREQRGHRLGLRLKVANLRQLQRHEDGGLLGSRRQVQTYCEQDNTAMRRINEAIGFREVDTLRGYEGLITD